MLLIVLGIICLILAAVITGLAFLWIIGIILIIAGVLLLVLSYVPAASGRWYGRRRYW